MCSDDLIAKHVKMCLSLEWLFIHGIYMFGLETR